jgi:hypothetical protein
VTNEEQPTELERILTRLENIPLFARIIVYVVIIVAVLTAAAKIIEDVPKILSIFSPSKSRPAPFDAQVQIIDSPSVLFWVVNDDINHTYCPIAVRMFMDITNLQPFPKMLSEVTVEAQDVDGNWIRLPHIHFDRGVQLYMGSDPTNVRRVEANVVDQMIRGRSLEPHVPLRGWMFFKKAFQNDFSRVRITVKDTFGVAHTTGPLRALNTGLKTVNVITTDQKRDLTKLHINYHCGV